MEEKKESALWNFLNSNFGLFVCSSIILGLISWGYGEVQLNSKLKAEHFQKSNQLLTEIKYRTILLETSFKKVNAMAETDSSRYAVMYDIQNILNGTTESKTKSYTEFNPVYNEFEGRGLLSLYWEYKFTSNNFKSEGNNPTIGKLIDFDVSLQDLISRDLDTDSGFSNQSISGIKQIFEDFKKEVETINNG